jgi:hypothetical protein
MGQAIKKIIPLLLTLQLIFYVSNYLPFPVNTSSIISTLDDAIKLSVLKEQILEQFEENETINNLKTAADDMGMIVLIGVPLVIFLLILAVFIIYCCKKSEKW